MPTLTEEHAHAINGVPGRMFAATTRHDEKPGCFCSQRWISEARDVSKQYGEPARMSVEMRFDDDCRNGHNTFAITATVYHNDHRTRRDNTIALGAMHEEIAQVFPELAPFVRWHLVSSDGPLHYVANALYLAGDRDYNGLRKGERRPQYNRDGLPRWDLVAVMKDGVKISTTPTGLQFQGAATVPLYILETHHAGENPPATPTLEWRAEMLEGKGKERELDAARRVAVWPDATDEELSAEPEALRAALEARLPALLDAFRAEITGAGFLWTSEAAPV